MADAKLEILDINERINGQQSEQLANENSLRNEGIANAKERQAIKQTEADAQDALDSAAAEKQVAKEETEAAIEEKWRTCN